MELKENIEKALNEQVNAELYSSYLYLSMSAYYQSKGLTGFANWMRVQAQEELYHAIKLYDYINERGGRPVMMPISAPPKEWDSPLHVAREQLKHERYVSDLINKLLDLTIEEKDHAAMNFLQWYIKEQVEEEDTATDMVNKLSLIGEEGNGIFMLDKEVGQRPPLFQFPHEIGKE